MDSPTQYFSGPIWQVVRNLESWHFLHLLMTHHFFVADEELVAILFRTIMDFDLPAQLPRQGHDLRSGGGEPLLHLWLHPG